MASAKQILIALDDLHGAKPVVDYVAQLSSERNDCKIHLFHALSPLPPQLLESSGSEDPRDEQKIEASQERQQNAYLERARKRAQPLMEQAKSWLIAAKVPISQIEAHLIALNQRTDLIAEIVNTAHRYHCGTVVVGHTAYPWLREQFHSHVSEQLMAHSAHFAVCVVRAEG